MKLLILGRNKTFETSRILEECKNVGIDGNFQKVTKIKYLFNKGLEVLINGKNILDYEVVHIRGVGNFLNQVSLLAKYLHRKGIIIIDEKLATTKYTADKTLSMFLCDKYNLPYPKTIQVFSKDELQIVEENLKYPLIAKEIRSSQGKGVHLIKDKNDLKIFVESIENISDVMFQKKLRQYAEDYRVFVVGDKGLGIMKKIAQEGEYRSNVSQGGITEMIKNDEILQLGIEAARKTKTEIAGVDIMIDESGKPYILEINRAPQFKGFESSSQINVAKEIVMFIKEKYEKSINLK